MPFVFRQNVLTKYKPERGKYDVVVPSGVASIGDRAFSECYELRSVTLPNSLVSIGKNAFFSCAVLQNITIPKRVKVIGESAFEGCYTMNSVNISDSVEIIGESAFKYCTGIKNINIPKGLKVLENSIFEECEGIEKIIIPDSIYKIGNSAFYGCRNLKELTVSTNIKAVGNSAFTYCSNVKRLNVSEYTFYFGKGDFTRTSLQNIVAILNTNDYSVPLELSKKYRLAVQVFLKTKNSVAESYIKNNISKIVKSFIDTNDYECIEWIFGMEEFINKRNIMDFVDYSIQNTQKGGDVQIQIFIMDYKNRKFPDIDPMDCLKL